MKIPELLVSNIEIPEQLVKLASIGTAGVCVLAIFFIGISIYKLSNDVPESKVTLLKTFMYTCVFIALICGTSGVANAYFNQNKVKVAENKLHELGNIYEDERTKWMAAKTRLKQQVNALKTTLELNPNVNASSIRRINALGSNISEYQMRSREELMRDIEEDR